MKERFFASNGVATAHGYPTAEAAFTALHVRAFAVRDWTPTPMPDGLVLCRPVACDEEDFPNLGVKLVPNA
jgi:hypothetical protein